MYWGLTVTELGAYLEREMQQRGWTQRAAADRAQLSKTTLTDILSGKKATPELPTLQKIADGFQVPLRRLLELCGYEVEEVDTESGEAVLRGLTDGQRAFLRNLSPEKKARLVEMARQFLEE